MGRSRARRSVFTLQARSTGFLSVYAERIIWEAAATPKEKHPAGPRAAAAIVPLFSP